MYAHHERVIQRLVERFKDDPRFPALIVGGSIAKGREKADSDVDILLVATDEEFARRLREVDMHYVDLEIADYPSGYVEGKVIDRQFLVDAADHGSEPARAAFKGAFVAYSRIPDLEELLAGIPVYPERDRAEKIRAFYIQLDAASRWFMPDAEKRDDSYLRAWAAATSVFYGCRLILAHNRILYPWHKWLLHEARNAPDKPADFIELAERLLRESSRETATAFRDSVMGFRDWGVSWDKAVGRFILDIEWNWRDGRPPLAEW